MTAAVFPAAGDFRTRLLASPMTGFQKRALTVCALLNVLDGFDVFSITFAAPAIARELHIAKDALGFVFAAGLIGMALGSLLLSPLADLYGRRSVVLGALLLMIVGTVWTAVAPGLPGVGASRVLTGLGIGALVSVINPLAAEYANSRRRDLCVTLMNLGFPAGGVIGGLAATALLPHVGWRAIFIVATVLAVAMLVVTLVWLPEPLTGLLARPRATTLTRVNAFLARCHQPAIAALPAHVAHAKRSFAALLTPAARGTTLRITLIYFLYVMSVFYIHSWIPSLVVGAGYTPAQAAGASVILNLSGVVGGLGFGLLVPRFGLKPIVIVALLLSAAGIVLFGAVPPRLGALQAMAAVVGVATIGGMTNLYAVVSRSFPAAARASGTGFVIGIGRFGSALGPALGGILLAHGLVRAEVSWALALPAAAAAAILGLARLTDRDI